MSELVYKNPLYLCSPEKYTECPKTACYLHGGPCMFTTYEEYAAKDENGKAIEFKERLTEKNLGGKTMPKAGDKYIIEIAEEYKVELTGGTCRVAELLAALGGEDNESNDK